ncbi:hypothetical protein EYD45_02790 [Hyunsoonleella flava]|uniref:Uncharacterized protein n=1 Tax=Hyunsoonleella flava TaxID=2527939 RepID=A0A4Q9FI82_9FLAO|nr:hypothetical protein [Hyunsoonleella flava]TBN06828.1 hypothetical protein EYD45_02790 [Hyunsoonleella flava]
MTKFCIYAICLLMMSFDSSFGQNFRKDSLQFKVYTIASFKDSKVKNIKVDKVLCDYCSEAQFTTLKQMSIKSSMKLIEKPKYRLINGEKRLAIYIRVKRENFAKLKHKDSLR